VTELPHNPLKLPLYWLGIPVGVVLVIVGLVSGPAWLILAGVLLPAYCGLGLRTVKQGRNPWYTRSVGDRLWAARRRG
jgi:hypothetical protein